jgi:tripartite-type tricarboxylate transporter receptor subunit TctC
LHQATRHIFRVGALLYAASFNVLAQSDTHAYPQKPIRVVAPFTPGGATDILGRVLAPKLSEQLGKPIVLDHRPGAGGNIGVELVATAPPDGYTLLLGNISTNAINTILYAKRIKVDTNKALTGVTLLASIPSVIIGSPRVPATTLKEAIAYARERPGQLNFIGNTGSYSHLDMLALMAAAGIKLVHIPSKGAGETLPGLMRGEVHITESNVASNLGAIQAGQIKAYAVTSTQRLRELPDVPTLAESGFPGIGSMLWTGLFAPTRTPKPVLDKLFAATVSVLREPQLKDYLEKRTFSVEPSASPAEFNAFVQAEVKRWEKIIRENDVKID